MRKISSSSLSACVAAALVLLLLCDCINGAPQRRRSSSGIRGRGNGNNKNFNSGAANNNNRGRQLSNAGGGNNNNNNRGRALQQGQQAPMNYNFDWAVDAQEYANYYGHRESAANGRVEGSYYVWLPDQRLMRVDYYVEADSGYVPTITYEDAYSPQWGSRPYKR